MNILVLGMGSNVSQGIVKALRNIKRVPIKIIGACISATSVGLYLCDEVLLMPQANDDLFIPWYIETCRKKEIDMTFTGVEENINTFVYDRERIEKESKAKFVYPEKKVWEIGRDKLRTCQWLKENGMPYPDYALASDDKEIVALINRVGFPLIAKPRIGKSSHGIIKVEKLKDMQEIIGNNNYVIQECVGKADDEYTVGCYFSKEGRLQAKIIMHRYLKNGGTSIAEIVRNSEIENAVDKICERLFMTGPLNLQLRMKEDGTPVCFEWNVRYSGTTAIRNHFGFKDVEAAIHEYFWHDNMEHCFCSADSGVAVRMDEEVYFENINLKQMILEMKL